MSREPIKLTDSLQDVLVTMSEGNPGAINVMMSILEYVGPSIGYMNILSLDDMNMRGPQIWIGYKDHCGQDIKKFVKCIQERDPIMIKAINNGRSKGHTAVTSGASNNR